MKDTCECVATFMFMNVLLSLLKICTIALKTHAFSVFCNMWAGAVLAKGRPDDLTIIFTKGNYVTNCPCASQPQVVDLGREEFSVSLVALVLHFYLCSKELHMSVYSLFFFKCLSACYKV